MPIKSVNEDPCHIELEAFTICVKSHPKGLKETDCDSEKNRFRQCMKEWKEKNSKTKPASVS
jgi:hypothetical protein